MVDCFLFGYLFDMLVSKEDSRNEINRNLAGTWRVS